MALLQEIKVPLLSVNDTNLTVVEVLFTDGDHVRKNETILVFETSKTTYDVAAEEDGYIQYLCRTGNDYDVNEVVAKIFSQQTEIEKIIASKPVTDKSVMAQQHITSLTSPKWKGDTLFSSAAIVLMEANGISNSVFAEKDFVSKYDVEEMIGLNGKTVSKISKPANSGQINKSSNQAVDSVNVIVEKLSSNKKKEIEFLSQVQSTGLTSTVNTVVDTEGIFIHINQSLKFLKDSLLPLIVYETGRLLQKYTRLNAWFTGEGTAFYKEVNIGFAIDIDKGLKVVKIENAPQKTLREIEDDIINLSNKYIDETLQIGDLTGVTFTITDLSSEGVAFFTPLVNMMNSAILGISSIDTKLNRCILSVTFDHRITEGKLVAQFLKELKDRLESYQSKFHPNLNNNITCFKCYKSLSDDLSDVGFAKCITPEGKEALVCQSCLKGY